MRGNANGIRTDSVYLCDLRLMVVYCGALRFGARHCVVLCRTAVQCTASDVSGPLASRTFAFFIWSPLLVFTAVLQLHFNCMFAGKWKCIQDVDSLRRRTACRKQLIDTFTGSRRIILLFCTAYFLTSYFLLDVDSSGHGFTYFTYRTLVSVTSL